MTSHGVIRLLLVALVVTGCAIDLGPLQPERRIDAGVRRDAGRVDGGRRDAGPGDAGSSDSGPRSDAWLGPPGRIGAGILALYTFDEGGDDLVHDVSGLDPAVDLRIESAGNAEWGGGTLTITGDNVVRSGVPATKIIERCMASDQITVEIWCQTDDTNQEGPARLVTLSQNAFSRNFTLGHEWGAFELRLRRAGSTLNGEPHISTGLDAVTTNLTHYVFVRDTTGNAIVYLDGVRTLEDAAAGDFDGWDPAYELALANELDAPRPWRGTYHLVALYSRALSETEVATNFAAGPD